MDRYWKEVIPSVYMKEWYKGSDNFTKQMTKQDIAYDNVKHKFWNWSKPALFYYLSIQGKKKVVRSFFKEKSRVSLKIEKVRKEKRRKKLDRGTNPPNLHIITQVPSWLTFKVLFFFTCGTEGAAWHKKGVQRPTPHPHNHKCFSWLNFWLHV